MKCLFAAALAFAFSIAARAGMTYRFENVSEGTMAHTLTGIVKIEGGKSRVEITHGSGEPFAEEGSVTLSSSDSPVLTVINPAHKTYYEIDAGRLTTSSDLLQQNLGKFITTTEPRVEVKDEGDGGLIDGYPTRRYLVKASMEMRFNGPGARSVTRIDFSTDVWTTDRIPAEASKQIQTPLRGMAPDTINRLIDATHERVPGFPLKEDGTAHVDINGSTTTMTRHTKVTGFHPATFAPSEFAVPAGYTKADSPLDALMKKLGGE